MAITLPNDTQHIAIVGKNGSGKTMAAVWHLSQRSFDTMPWIVFNFKGDDLIDSIIGRKEWSLDKAPPTEPGIYIVRPMPHETEELDEFLWKVWANEDTGLYFDEGYMVGNSKPFQTIMTQGRSKHLPSIVLTQRPVSISRFVWSESNYFQIFRLTNEQDKKTVREFVPVPKDIVLKPFHSVYYDATQDDSRPVMLLPVPDRDIILKTFRNRLRIKRFAL